MGKWCCTSQKKKNTLVSQPVKKSILENRSQCFVCLFFFFCAFHASTARRTWNARHVLCTGNKFCRLWCISQFQLRPAQPPPRATAGHFPALSVLGVGHLQILCCPGAGHLPNLGPTRTFDTHTVSYQKITTQRILLELQADWLICQGQERIGEVCVGMISILRMHFFIAYHARIT